MNIHLIVEMTGYLASALILISFLMTSVVKLRVINAVGGVIFTVYALIIHSYPTALMNLCLVAINLYYLFRLRNAKHAYDFMEGKPGEAFVQYVLNVYDADIRKFFPDYDAKEEKPDTAYVVCHKTAPVGILLGKKKPEGELEAVLDYSVPAYRDCSVGRYLYGCLEKQGIRSVRVSFPGEKGLHEAYVKAMGFRKENGGYVKNLTVLSL